MTPSNDRLQFLKERNSAPRLTEPGPSATELNEMLACALRSPDHAWLRPWRFLSVTGERRQALGECLERSLLRRNPEAEGAAREKALKGPLRAPTVIVVLAKLQEHPKVPYWEQRVSAGCAAFSLLLAAEALGYGGVWRTGDYPQDPELVADLGSNADEEIVGFIYLGSRDGGSKALPPMNVEDFHRAW
ncbi:MAG: nitroreductase family protein [Pseudomonadota bacterium]